MSINKNAMLRYRVLDRCFRNPGRNFFIDDLLHEVNKELEEYNGPDSKIKRRQLFDDIKFMKSDQGWSIPLKTHKDGRKTYYRYEDIKFSISNQPLNESESSQISAAIEVLSRFSGAPQFEWVQELIPVLKDRFDVKTNSKEIISIESNIDLKGIEHLSPLYEAINKEQVLSICYKDFKTDESYSFTFHPYYIKQYNNRWFVIGLNPYRDTPTWTVALDRILTIGYLTDSYQSSKIDWNDYFYDIIGVTRPTDTKVESIQLEVTKEQAPYIETKPLHPTQKSYWQDDKLIVEFKVIPNYELETLILSFGENIKVQKPNNLSKKIRERIKCLYKYYLI
jgi:predicted DNA-binding transcriptional regulator YafY